MSVSRDTESLESLFEGGCKRVSGVGFNPHCRDGTRVATDVVCESISRTLRGGERSLLRLEHTHD